MKVGGLRRVVRRWPVAPVTLSAALLCAACAQGPSAGPPTVSVGAVRVPTTAAPPPVPASTPTMSGPAAPDPGPTTAAPATPDLDIRQDLREQFQHGPKPAAYQRYIVLHDTEGRAGPADQIASWARSDRMVAAHFVVGTDGSVWQAVPLDVIAHHAGYGDTGHDDLYGVPEDGRDDMRGTTPIGRWAADYGMNAWSVGIELVHVGGSGDYPSAQLDALDRLIAYVDGYYGFDSTIIDHKAWRSGNSDTSPEFARYLAAYQDHRTHQ